MITFKNYPMFIKIATLINIHNLSTNNYAHDHTTMDYCHAPTKGVWNKVIRSASEVITTEKLQTSKHAFRTTHSK